MLNEKSGCCGADLLTKRSPFGGDIHYICGGCSNYLSWALISPNKSRHYAPGVFEDWNGDWWFAEQQSGYVEHIDRLVANGHKAIAIRGVVSTVGLRHDSDIDLIGTRKHIKFVADYIGRVKNPEHVHEDLAG